MLQLQKTPEPRHRRWILIALITLVVILGAAALSYWWLKQHESPREPATTPSSQPTTKVQTPTTPATQAKPTYDTTTPSSLQVVVNKKHPLSPLDYAPTDLVPIGSQMMRSEAAAAVKRMQTDSGAGIAITPASGYRSYDKQVTVYNGYVKQDGQAKADTYSARPGYSEHQTGLAMDFSPIDVAFANTAQFTWLQENAYKYGFVLRYPDGKTDITGYTYEPWHWRYIGVEVATDMHQRAILTLEEYFSISGGDYE